MRRTEERSDNDRAMLDDRDDKAPDNERLERTGETATRPCESARRRPLSRALGARLRNRNDAGEGTSSSAVGQDLA